MSLFLALSVFTLVSLGGLLIYIWKDIPRTPLMFLVALGAGSMLSVSIVHILPETFEWAGEHAVYAFLWGFLFLYILEEILTPHKHDTKHGDHVHEDPHEHTDHVTIVAWSGIFLHTLLDGISIAAGFSLSSELGFAVLFGIMVHQLPVSLGLAWILRQSHLKLQIQIILMVLFWFAALIGYLFSLSIFQGLSHEYTLLAWAFAGWSLLYIATTDLLPMIHGQVKQKYTTLICFLLGALIMIAAHEMWHEHHEEEEIRFEVMQAG